MHNFAALEYLCEVANVMPGILRDKKRQGVVVFLIVPEAQFQSFGEKVNEKQASVVLSDRQ